MADSFQKEIPKARINLSLDVETGDAKKTMELPLNMLVMGDFSNGKAEGRLAERERINITKNNFKAIMKNMAPQVTISVPNTSQDDESEIKVDLTLDSIDSFHPEQVAKQIPELHSLLAMRNLLKDLRSNLLDNIGFRKEMEKIVNDQPELEGLRQHLEKIIEADPNT
ncbi:MAG: type VI secretion system contractile sheath small subunit [Thermodesulfobacteriota bacterium]